MHAWHFRLHLNKKKERNLPVCVVSHYRVSTASIITKAGLIGSTSQKLIYAVSHRRRDSSLPRMLRERVSDTHSCPEVLRGATKLIMSTQTHRLLAFYD